MLLCVVVRLSTTVMYTAGCVMCNTDARVVVLCVVVMVCSSKASEGPHGRHTLVHRCNEHPPLLRYNLARASVENVFVSHVSPR